MKIFVEATSRIIRMTIQEQVKKVLSEYQDTALHHQVTEIVRQYLVELKGGIEKQAMELYKLEMTQPVARNRSTMQKLGESYYHELKKARKEIRVRSLLQSRGQTLYQDRTKAEKYIENMNLGPDHFENEIKMMAVSSTAQLHDGLSATNASLDHSRVLRSSICSLCG